MTNVPRSVYAIPSAVAAALLGLWIASFLRSSSAVVHVAGTELNFNATGQDQTCIDLASVLPDVVFSQQHFEFQTSLTAAYALQATEQVPTCIVKPRNVEDVATAVRTLKRTYDTQREVRFVVRSGGHRPGPGHSSIEGGVMIDLSRINDVTVSQDRQRAIVASGARWGHVYRQLESEGLTVAGGRNTDVGVGGLTLGGGISFFSPQVGMVCDNVLEYETVLANGTILHVSELDHPDLWRSLRGGSSNFGIVTRFTFRTLPSTMVWGGHIFYPFWNVAKVLGAFHDFVKLERVGAFNEYAASPIFSMNFIDLPIGHLKILAVNAVYTKPETWPACFAAFKSIWPLWSTAKIRSIADAGDEHAKFVPRGRRQHYSAITVTNEHNALRDIPAMFEKSTERLGNVKGLTWTLVLQPLPATITHKGVANVLGLDARDRSDPTPIIVLLCPSWTLSTDDVLVNSVARELLVELKQLSERRGNSHDYVYLNYAGDQQDPFAGYGEANEKFLQEMIQKYDPDRFFQRARAGGFKLER